MATQQISLFKAALTTRVAPAIVLAILLLVLVPQWALAKSYYVLKHSVVTSAKPNTVWRLWEDVENWRTFDTLLEYSRLEPGHTFSNGARGVIKARGALRTKFKLLDVKPQTSFTERLYVPLFQTIDLKRHVTRNAQGQTVFTHEVHFRGSLKFIIRAIAAKSFKKELPLVMTRLKDLAEQRDAEQPE